jgi:hypothetical protein
VMLATAALPSNPRSQRALLAGQAAAALAVQIAVVTGW